MEEGISFKVGKDDNSDLEHVVIFNVEEEEYGIQIENVKEIDRVSNIVHFPGAPDFVRGMVNLRGEVIPILNLKSLFHILSTNESTKFLVVEFEKKRIVIHLLKHP